MNNRLAKCKINGISATSAHPFSAICRVKTRWLDAKKSISCNQLIINKIAEQNNRLCKSAHFALQKGLFREVKRPFLQDKSTYLVFEGYLFRLINTEKQDEQNTDMWAQDRRSERRRRNRQGAQEVLSVVRVRHRYESGKRQIDGVKAVATDVYLAAKCLVERALPQRREGIELPAQPFGREM